MRPRRNIRSDERGAAVIETAFALPVLVVMIWMLVQMAQVYRAYAGIQHALGEGARAATLWSTAGVDIDVIKAKVDAAVYGIGPGTFSDPSVITGTDCDKQCLDVTVSYTQPTNMLLFPGPTIQLSRTKRVWTATKMP
jgi:hypothetical protein